MNDFILLSTADYIKTLHQRDYHYQCHLEIIAHRKEYPVLKRTKRFSVFEIEY